MAKTNKALLDEAVGVYLSSLKYLNEFISEPTTKYGLSFEQYLILHSISDRKDISLMDIAKERNVTRSAISRQIKVLLQHDYIYQRPSQSDRRRLFLHLTPDGQKVEKRVYSAITKRFDHWINTFGEDKVRETIELIKKFHNREMHEENN